MNRKKRNNDTDRAPLSGGRGAGGEGEKGSKTFDSIEREQKHNRDKPSSTRGEGRGEVNKLPLHAGAEPRLFKHARELHREMTDAEKVLWKHLRARRFLNLKFRRQHPILEFIADFYCHELKLIVEADGGYHEEADAKYYDDERTKELKQFGITVVRFSNEEILSDVDGVLVKLKERVLELKPDLPLPRPLSSEERDRERSKRRRIMKLIDLLEEFNVVINTPESLNELRSLILRLAVRGKLVPQDPNDESASELLKKIEAKKERLYEEGKIRKPKNLPKVEDDEFYFDAPSNWQWIRLGEIGDWGAGATPTRSNSEYYGGDIPWLKTGELNDSFIKEAEEFITEKGFENSSVRLCKPGDVLIAMYGATIGKLGILEFEATTNQACCACTTFEGFYNIYLYYYLLSMRENFRNQGAGGAQPNISKTKIENTVLPLPPLAEQHRIVQKIESLFAEVDELEAKLNRQAKLDKKLQVAVNAEVQQAPDTQASKTAWGFITSNFNTLYHTPEAIDNLKKNILNEAVRGRLVPQNPHDEPASELLKKIEAEKNRLYEEGGIRKPKKLPPVEEEKIPFQIPESWEWVRVETVGITQTGTTPKTSNSEFYGDYIPFVGPGDMSIDEIDYSNNGLSEKGLEVGRLIPKGSILMVCIGGSIGKCHIVNRDVSCNQQINTIFPIAGISSHYIKSVFRSDYFQKAILSKSTGSATPIINRTKWGNIPISLPPLEEQHRIVLRIEELFAICDRFKAQLVQREKVNERLVKGLVGEVLEGSH